MITIKNVLNGQPFFALLQPSKQDMQKFGSSKEGVQKTRKVIPQVNYGS